MKPVFHGNKKGIIMEENFGFRKEYEKDSMGACSYIEYLEIRLSAELSRRNILLKIHGWSREDCLKVIQKIEAWNGGLPSHLFCTEETLIDLFNSYPYFGTHKIIVDEKIIRKYASIAETNLRIVVVESLNGKVAGVICL